MSATDTDGVRWLAAAPMSGWRARSPPGASTEGLQAMAPWPKDIDSSIVSRIISPNEHGMVGDYANLLQEGREMGINVRFEEGHWLPSTVPCQEHPAGKLGCNCAKGAFDFNWATHSSFHGGSYIHL